ncbi:hypothetical protein DMN91_010309 [Ooceraea biroi]|uniref:Uncharacterized protein n=1 Tax=Ooceraea biroi TaxID=2015173 RepID=A0A3L8DCN8_OOCBI|nr:hypothetical protein DMN91_010309 [Ooceraea biroi]
MSASILLEEQLQLKHSISRFIENFKKTGRKNWTLVRIRSRITFLKETWKQMRCGHAALSKVADEKMRSTHAYFDGDVIAETEDTYQNTLDFLSECLEELEPPSKRLNTSIYGHLKPLIEEAFSINKRYCPRKVTKIGPD